MEPSSSFPPGALAVVGIPLGNPSDITLRALEVLRMADLVATEDTRTLARLLSRHEISARLLSYHDWNEAERSRILLQHLKQGKRVALTSEAGTPGISDPGFEIVRRAREQGFNVFPVPGPCALTAFLSASGLPTHSFSFFGFPPNRKNRRRAMFERLISRTETLIFYESPRRIVAALRDALEIFGNRECALVREMTKPHEEFVFASLTEVLAVLETRHRVRGEVCWGLRGAESRSKQGKPSLEQATRSVLAKGLAPRPAAREVAQLTGATAKEAYASILAMKAREELGSESGGESEGES